MQFMYSVFFSIIFIFGSLVHVSCVHSTAPKIMGFYGNCYQVVLSELEALRRSSVSYLKYEQQPFPRDYQIKDIRFVIDHNNKWIAKYKNPQEFEIFCEKQLEIWKDHPLMLESIRKCQKIVSNNQASMVDVYMLINEVSLYWEQEQL